jgi:hypothetical protein
MRGVSANKARCWHDVFTERGIMRSLRACLAPILTFAASACGSGHSVDQSNAAIAQDVNAAASNISILDGREASAPPSTPQEAGAAMRAAAAERPRPQ